MSTCEERTLLRLAGNAEQLAKDAEENAQARRLREDRMKQKRDFDLMDTHEERRAKEVADTQRQDVEDARQFLEQMSLEVPNWPNGYPSGATQPGEEYDSSEEWPKLSVPPVSAEEEISPMIAADEVAPTPPPAAVKKNVNEPEDAEQKPVGTVPDH